MPFLCGDNELKGALKLIGEWDHRVTVRDRRRPTGKKIILQVEHDERVHG